MAQPSFEIWEYNVAHFQYVDDSPWPGDKKGGCMSACTPALRATRVRFINRNEHHAVQVEAWFAYEGQTWEASQQTDLLFGLDPSAADVADIPEGAWGLRYRWKVKMGREWTFAGQSSVRKGNVVRFDGLGVAGW